MTQFGRLLGTPAVAVWELRETVSLEALTLGGWAPAAHRDWISSPLDAPAPVADVARRGQPLWLETVEDWRRDYPHLLDLIHTYGYASVETLPLSTGDDCFGVVAIGFTDERLLSSAERTATIALAEQCATAPQRAHLLQAESDARQVAERFDRLLGAVWPRASPVRWLPPPPW